MLRLENRVSQVQGKANQNKFYFVGKEVRTLWDLVKCHGPRCILERLIWWWYTQEFREGRVESLRETRKAITRGDES